LEEEKFEIPTIDPENDDCFEGSNKHMLCSSYLASLNNQESSILKIEGTDNLPEEYEIDVGDNGQIEAQEHEVEHFRANSYDAIQMEDQLIKPQKH
jgi:hypothetical protein